MSRFLALEAIRPAPTATIWLLLFIYVLSRMGSRTDGRSERSANHHHHRYVLQYSINLRIRETERIVSETSGLLAAPP